MKCLFLFCFFLITPMVFGQIDLQTVATVRLARTENITVGQFREYAEWVRINKAMASQNPAAQLTESERRQALEDLGNQLLAVQAAQQERITINEQAINQQFEESIRNLSTSMAQVMGRTPTTAEIDAELRRNTGMSRENNRSLMRRTVIFQRYLEEKKSHLFEAIDRPSEAEIRTFYTQNRNRSIFDNGFSRPAAFRIRFLVAPFRNPAERTGAQTIANNLSRQIAGDPGRFDEAAREFMRPNSGYISGEGFVYDHDIMRESMGVTFVNSIVNLRLGQVSAVLERSDGFYIVRVMEAHRARVLELDETYNLEDPGRRDQAGRVHPPATVRQVITELEMQNRFNTVLERALQELATELRQRGSVQINESNYRQIVW